MFRASIDALRWLREDGISYGRLLNDLCIRSSKGVMNFSGQSKMRPEISSYGVVQALSFDGGSKGKEKGVFIVTGLDMAIAELKGALQLHGVSPEEVSQIEEIILNSVRIAQWRIDAQISKAAPKGT